MPIITGSEDNGTKNKIKVQNFHINKNLGNVFPQLRPNKDHIFDVNEEYSPAISVEIRDLLNRLNIKENESNKNLLNSLLTLLGHKTAQHYFKNNIEKYCEIVLLILNHCTNDFQFYGLIEHHNLFSKNIVDQETFYKNFIDELLEPLLQLGCRFDNPQNSKKVSEVIKRCIFFSNFKQFEANINDFFQNSEFSREKHTLIKRLFKFLKSQYSKKDANYVFRIIYNTYCITYTTFEMHYKMLILISKSIGFNLEKEFNLNKPNKLHNDNTELCRSLAIFAECLEVIKNSKLDDCTINEISFNDFSKKFIKSMINLTKQPTTHSFDVINNFIQINPIIVEPIIGEILIYFILHYNPQYLLKYEDILIKILEVFQKLHRISNLISKIIPTLKTALYEGVEFEEIYTFGGEVDISFKDNKHLEINAILPRNVLQYFTSCIVELASWQVMNLVKTLLYHFKVAINEIPFINEDPQKIFYMEFLSTLYYWILSSVRMAEQTTADSVVQKFVNSLEELRIVLGEFGSTLLLMKHNDKLMWCFLIVAYHWSEIYILLAYYSIDQSVKLKKVIDSDAASCNITYLHSYLDAKQWCLIYERISNFGEESCKELMQKLFIQKLKAMTVFEEEIDPNVVESVVETISNGILKQSCGIITENYVHRKLLAQMPTNTLLNLGEYIFNELSNNANWILLDKLEIQNNILITQILLCIIFKQINNSVKQKRKHDEDNLKQSLFTQIYLKLDEDIFLKSDEEIQEYISSNIELYIKNTEINNNIKIHSKKFNAALEILIKLPVVFTSEITQKLIILLLLSLHEDFIKNNNDNERDFVEKTIIALIESKKLTLLDLFEARKLTDIVMDNFVKYEDLYLHLVGNVFRTENEIVLFQSAIESLNKNLKDDRFLKCAEIVLNCTSKVKKSKMSTETKNVCWNYKLSICKKIVKLIVKKDVDNSLIIPYVYALRHFLAKDENDCLAKITARLNEYLKYILENLCDENRKGALLLLTTVFHNKSLLDTIDQKPIDIWNSFKMVNVTEDEFDEYSQLVNLIFGHIANDEFSHFANDLLNSFKNATENQESEQIIRHLKTCSSVLSCNFNPVKTKVLETFLGELLMQLVILLRNSKSNEKLINEIFAFEDKIIHRVQFLLTPTIVNYFLLTITLISTDNNDDNNFITNFNLAIALMESLLKFRKPWIMDRLTPYLQQYRILLKELCLRSKSDANSDPNVIKQISDCSHKLERLTKVIAGCTKDMTRIACYLIADILNQYEQITLHPNIKIHLNNCIYSLISLCDQHAVSYLLRVLSNASTELFKIMYENYKKYYRFTGKV